MVNHLFPLKNRKLVVANYVSKKLINTIMVLFILLNKKQCTTFNLKCALVNKVQGVENKTYCSVVQFGENPKNIKHSKYT